MTEECIITKKFFGETQTTCKSYAKDLKDYRTSLQLRTSFRNLLSECMEAFHLADTVKVHTMIFTREFMCTVYCVRRGVIIVDFTLRNKIIDAAAYDSTLKKLRLAFQTK